MRVPATDAKNRLGEMIDHVIATGETIVITRYGRPIADLGLHKPKQAEAEEADEEEVGGGN